MSIHMTVHGHGKPLVLFHGWGFDSQVWVSLIPALTLNHQLYLVDLPGFGLTPSISWEKFKSELLKQLPASFALGGWSMGGLLATRLAIEVPARVTHLINIASSPHFVRKERWPGIDPLVFKGFYDNLFSNPSQTLEQFIALQLRGQSLPRVKLGQTPTPAGLQAGLDLLVNWDLRPALTQLTIPVCYIFGRLDAITPRTLIAVMEHMYPNFHYKLFAKAAHVPFLSHPDEFMTTLEVFLQ